ncbi:hypothetical protein ABPG74_000308 [Tetrahymena malaccensis]
MVLGYLYRVIKNEIEEDLFMLKEILFYHAEQTKQMYTDKKQQNKLKKKIKNVQSYEEWKVYAQQLDSLKRIKQWKEKAVSKDYDYKYIINLKNKLKSKRQGSNPQQNVLDLVDLIRSHPFKNIANILNPSLYQQCFFGTKQVIHDFINELDQSIKYIAQSKHLDLSQKLEFFAEVRHALGRTAMVFSGGAFLGLYHAGVAKTLYEQNLLPRILAGSSAGSITAAFIGTTKYEDLGSYFDKEQRKINYSAFLQRDPRNSAFRKIVRFLQEGYFMDMNIYKKFLRDNLGDKTFQEAFDDTGFILNITVTGAGRHTQDRVLNYLTAPNVVIWSAVCCSCSLPFVFPPSDLYFKNRNGQLIKYIEDSKFIDGSIAFDIPHNQLSEQFNVSTTIVSQVNPHVVPLLNHKEKLRYKNKLIVKTLKILELIKMLVSQEVRLRFKQLNSLGILPLSLVTAVRVMDQNYEGDITVWPVPKLKDYLNLLKNPTSQEFIEPYTAAGARMTYGKIPHIEILTKFERVIEENYQNIKQQYYQQQGSNPQGFVKEIEDEENEFKQKKNKQNKPRIQSFQNPSRKDN